VGLGILLGTLLAFTVYHPYGSLVRRTRRPKLVAAGITVLAMLAVSGTIALLSYSVIRQGIELAAQLPQALAPGGRATVLLERSLAPLSALGMSSHDVAQRLRDAAGNIAAGLASVAARAVGAFLDALLTLFFTAFTMYFVLTRWKELTRHAEHLMPINPHHTRRLLHELRRIGRTAVVGNLGTALAQGLIAGVGYAVAGIPEPAFFGALTAMTSLVPVVGTLLLWVPAGLLLLAEGHFGAGIFELVWGSLAVVMLCDYVIRPKLVAGGEPTPTWMTFAALFGGLKLFGFAGFLLGPLLAGVALAALKLYGRTRRFRLGLS
jgi:predicted PurR-regulated permease PerM